MTLFLFLFNNQIYLLLLSVLFYIISLSAIKYKKYRYQDIVFTNTPKSRDDFFKHLDRYYVKNKLYTIFAVSIYIFFQTGWIVVYRVVFMSYDKTHKSIFPVYYENMQLNYSVVFWVITFTFLLMLTLLMFKLALSNLLYDETLKLHILLLKYAKYYKFISYFDYGYLINFWGKCYLFFFNICKLRLNYITTETEFYSFFRYGEIYENKHIIYLSKTFVTLAKRRNIYLGMFNFLEKTFRWLYHNMRLDGMAYYMLYISMTMIISYNFIYPTSKPGYYLFFIIYFIIQSMVFAKFLTKRDPINDHVISEYFYENDVDYKTQRLLLKKNPDQFYNDLYKSTQSKSILHWMNKVKNDDNIVNYVLNNCIEFHSRDIKLKNLMKNFHASHKRFYLLCLSIMGVLFILLNKQKYTLILAIFPNTKISLMILFLPILIISIYSAGQIYRSPSTNIENAMDDYIYKPKYKMLFWLSIMIYVYIFWLLILKANIFVISDGIIWNHAGILLQRNYTLEEKYIYFYQNLDGLLNEIENRSSVKDIITQILFLIEELQWKEFITDDTTINETKAFVEIFIESYFEQVVKHLESIAQEQLLQEGETIRIKFFRDTIFNSINIIVLVKVIIMYKNAWHIAANPTSLATGKYVHGLLRTIYKIIITYRR